VGKSGQVPVDMQGFTIPAASKNPAAALDLALFVTNDENQLAFCHLATILPSTIKAAQDPFFQAPGDVKQQARKISADSLSHAKDATLSVANYDKLLKSMNDSLNTWWNGSATPQQALDAAAKAWDTQLASQ
jgi:putative chitobiose transport system substrate-binding protein